MIMPPVIELTFSIPKEYFQYLSVLSYYRSDKDQEHILSVLVSITLYGMSVVPTWITGKSIGFACKLLDLIISPVDLLNFISISLRLTTVGHQIWN